MVCEVEKIAANEKIIQDYSSFLLIIFFKLGVVEA